MKNNINSLCRLKWVCLLIIAVLSISLLHSQNNNTDSLFFYVIAIDKNTSLTATEKLKALYKIKKDAEEKTKTHDSGYLILLLKIAKNEGYTNDSLAVYYLSQALELNKKLPKPVSNKILINCYYNLARCYDQLLQPNKALAGYDSVLSLCKQPDPDDYITDSRYGKARIYSALGDYEKEADECTMGMVQAFKKSDTSRLITFLNLRADALIHINQLNKALSDVETAIPMEKKIGNNNELANSYLQKANIYKNQNKNADAEQYYQKVIQMRPHVSSFYERIASDYNMLAIFYLNNVNNFKKAKENYLQSLYYANLCSPAVKPFYLLTAYVNIGELYQRQEKYVTKSIAYYNLAFQQLHFYTNNFLFINPTLASLSFIESNPSLFILLNNKTELLLTLYKKYKQKKYLDACLQTALLTDSIITQTRHQNIGEGSKLYWRDNSREFFSYVIEACYLSNDVNKAFYFMEKSRSVLLNDKWNELSANNYLPEKESDKREYFQQKIANQRETLASLPSSSVEYYDVQNQLLSDIDSLELFIKSLEKKYPAYYQSKYSDNVPPLSSLQSYLTKNNQSFVYYFMNDSAMYALAITQNKANFIKIDATDFDNKLLSQFIRLCSDKEQLNKHYDLYCSLSQRIYKKIFLPLQLPKGKIAICTDNFFIPFEALCSDDKGKQYLLYQYSFSYVYSARSLLKSFNCSPASGEFIGFAPVSFSQSLDVLDLQQSAIALQNSAHFYTSNTLFTQQQATRSNFIQHASHYSVVTIFSHAKADTTDAEPVLYMQDSLIHLSDLQRLSKPSIQFVLLSACQTNTGKNATGEGIYSLARGFAAAGIPSVSATLWKADEGAVYAISTKFNEYLAKGMNKSEALQKAKIGYLQANKNNENSLPYYWANMVLIGRSQPIVLSSSNPWWLWVSGVVVSVVLMVFLFYFIFYKNKEESASCTPYFPQNQAS